MSRSVQSYPTLPSSPTPFLALLCPSFKVIRMTLKTILEELSAFLLKDAMESRRRALDDDAAADEGDMAVFGLNDPPGYSTLGSSLQFLTEFGTPKNGGGNKRRDAVIPKRYSFRFVRRWSFFVVFAKSIHTYVLGGTTSRVMKK